MKLNFFERIFMIVGTCFFWAGAAHADDMRFGVIEIGGSGVKASIVRLVESVSPAEESDVDLTVEREYPTRNANAAFPEQAQPVADIVAGYARAMRAEGVSALRIYVVGSSGLAAAPHGADLRARVNRAVAGDAGAMQFVSGEDQAAFAFAGILNCRRLAHRRDESVLIDIGSAEVSFAYVERPAAHCGEEVIGARSTSWGVKTLARRVSERAGGAGGETLAGVRAAAVKAEIDALARTAAPGVITLPRVYLGGGIVWAVAALTHPEQRGRYIRLTPDDFDAVRAQLLENPACLTDLDMAARADRACRRLDVNFSSIADPVARAAARADHREIVVNVFTLEQLQVAMDALVEMSGRLRFQGRTVFFARPARRAWMLGYLLAREGRAEAASAIVPR